jgi:hypothetical protein
MSNLCPKADITGDWQPIARKATLKVGAKTFERFSSAESSAEQPLFC